MKFLFSQRISGLLLAAPCFLAHAALPESAPELAAQTEVASHWRLTASPYSVHYNPDERHEPVWAIGVELQRDDRWLFGASYFSNSFGQPSGYVYAGQRFDGLLGRPQLFWQWSAGLLYGYRGEFKDKVPLNYNGFSPGALLSLGWQFNRQVSSQINTLGNSGLMWQLSWDLH
jgi:hypothetical protein